MNTTPPVLRGPADADHFRVKVGRYGDRWYHDPLPADDIASAAPEWQGPSISIVKKASGSDWTFVGLKRVAHAGDLAQVAALEPMQRYDRLKNINQYGLTQAAGRGTIIHLWAEDLLNGRTPRDISDLDLTAMRLPKAALTEALAYKAALVEFFDAHQPTLVAAEVVCIDRGLNGVGYGGTGDAIVTIDGHIVVIDWKSRGADSDHGAYPEEGAQIAALARAEYMIVDGPKRALIPQADHGLVVSIKPDGCRAYPVDLDKAQAHWTSLHAWWVARRDERAAVGKPWAPKVSAGGTGSKSQPTLEVDPPADEITITASNGHQPPVSVTYTRDQIRARIGELIAAGHEDRLRLAWPADVPPLSKPGQTAKQLEAVLNAVKRVEADTVTAFHPDDTPDPPATVVEPDPTPAPAGVELDEGGQIDAGARTLLEQDFNRLTDEQRNTIARITREAAEHGHSISVSANPTTRRWAIARALIRAAATGTDLWASAVDIATPEQVAANEDLTLGALISTFTIEQAHRLHDSLDHTVAA